MEGFPSWFMILYVFIGIFESHTFRGEVAVRLIIPLYLFSFVSLAMDFKESLDVIPLMITGSCTLDQDFHSSLVGQPDSGIRMARAHRL